MVWRWNNTLVSIFCLILIGSVRVNAGTAFGMLKSQNMLSSNVSNIISKIS
jgi:hypothetical protein